jgi:hypothetical protein
MPIAQVMIAAVSSKGIVPGAVEDGALVMKR